MARAATAPELVLFRTAGQRSKIRAAIFSPSTVYSGRINQTFSTLDKVLQITYDGGSGTLANVLPDMTLFVGTSAGAHDKGICRIRDKDATHFYIGETADISFADNDYLTVVNDFGLWARPILISGGVPYMDGGVAYSDQHVNFDPWPRVGGNRVLEKTGSTVSTTFDLSNSICAGSSISTYATSCATASSSSGLTTASPTLTFNTLGWHLVYFTLTAANGKSFFSVRYVYVWDQAHPPTSVQIDSSPRVDVESGGWEFSLTMFDDADTDLVRDHALVILFTEDHYGSTTQSIGPVVGCENILVQGWIAKETINWNPEQGSVSFTAYTAQYWLERIPAWPDGIQFTTNAPTAWTEMSGLTVDKGLYHFISWRTTAPRIMDVYLTGDTKYTKEVSSLASNLWEQIKEFAFLQIYARPGVNALNQLYIEVHPQLVPNADRTWPTVMTITKPDWVGEIDMDRVTMEEISILDLSGIAINASAVGAAYFALAPGHSNSHYGQPDIQNQLLVSSQSQTNTLAALYRSWKNNPYPSIPITFAANNRLIDCFPRQKCAITISPSDTPRGISYSGGLIPTSVAYVHDPINGYLHTEATFEAETGAVTAGLSQNGDIPGSGDVSVPPTPSFPPLPDFGTILPGTTDASAGGPTAVLLHDTVLGMLYTSNFDAATPTWITVNAGLSVTQYQLINRFFVCPNGAFYVAFCQSVDNGNYLSRPFFIARAPSIGATFTVLYDEPAIRPASPVGQNWGLFSAWYNPLVAESVGFVMGQVNVNKKFWIGSGSSFAAGASVDPTSILVAGLTYGFGFWLHTRLNHFSKIAPAGGSVVTTGSPAIDNLETVGDPLAGHVRGSTTGRTFHLKAGGGGYVVAENNLASITTYTDSSFQGQGFASDAAGLYLMTTYGVGARGRSSDAGATWSTIPALPFGSWWFDNAGASQRWVAAGGSSVRYSPDFGASWLNKEGNLISSPLATHIKGVKVVGF